MSEGQFWLTLLCGVAVVTVLLCCVFRRAHPALIAACTVLMICAAVTAYMPPWPGDIKGGLFLAFFYPAVLAGGIAGGLIFVIIKTAISRR